MTGGGDAVDQIVKITLESGEVFLRISGAAAKQLAVMIYAILKNQKRTKGRVRMAGMLRDGKQINTFSIRAEDLPGFAKGARQYGVLYCAVKSSMKKKDGLVDIVFKEEDAARISRIVERFRFGTVETARVEVEKGTDDRSRTDKNKADRSKAGASAPVLENDAKERTAADSRNAYNSKADNKEPGGKTPLSGSKEELLMEELYEQMKRGAVADRPFPATQERYPSGPSLMGTDIDRPSVRGQLREINKGRNVPESLPGQKKAKSEPTRKR